MFYKPDWENAQERMIAWWNREIIDRVAIQAISPKRQYCFQAKKDYSLIERWTNPEIIAEMYEDYFKRTYFGGEAYPYLGVTLGPSILGAFLGCELVFAEGTSWQKSFLKTIKDFKNMEFKPENKWYRLIHAITDLALERAENKFFVSIADLGSTAEVLAYMRGSDGLCYDLADYPDEVKAARNCIMDLWSRIYDELYCKIQKVMKGSCMWLSAWSPGKTYPLQCDFSAMLSPKMFEEFFLPEIQAQCKFLDHAVYHLDGKEAIKHLDLLLEIPELKAIQWCPGASAGENKSMLQWIPLLKRIQEKKKSIHIEVDNNEIEPLLQYISPYGLMIKTECGSEEEARTLLEKAGKWTLVKSAFI